MQFDERMRQSVLEKEVRALFNQVRAEKGGMYDKIIAKSTNK